MIHNEYVMYVVRIVRSAEGQGKALEIPTSVEEGRSVARVDSKST